MSCLDVMYQVYGPPQPYFAAAYTPYHHQVCSSSSVYYYSVVLEEKFVFVGGLNSIRFVSNTFSPRLVALRVHLMLTK